VLLRHHGLAIIVIATAIVVIIALSHSLIARMPPQPLAAAVAVARR
jgi:hypothetical protein